MGWFADGAWSSPPTSQKARKAHHCDRCLGTIRPGSAYLRWCSVDDGRATKFGSPAKCYAADYAPPAPPAMGDLIAETAAPAPAPAASLL